MLALFTALTPLPENCLLPDAWLRCLDPALMRVIVVGGRDYGERDNERLRMYRDLDRLREK
ncbi:MAG TPA: hypothetical protein VFL97_04610 [Nitrococcus sp.]|nr:hypothetical protein [Nitrococcus sp.]